MSEVSRGILFMASKLADLKFPISAESRRSITGIFPRTGLLDKSSLYKRRGIQQLGD